MNCIKAAIEANGISIARLSRESGVPYATLFAMVNGSSQVGNMGIDRFMKVAHALGMTADQLYHYEGEDDEPRPVYSDPRQAEINEVYEAVTEEGKQVMWTNAIMARNTFLDCDGSHTVQKVT